MYWAYDHGLKRPKALKQEQAGYIPRSTAGVVVFGAFGCAGVDLGSGSETLHVEVPRADAEGDASHVRI